MSDKDVVRNEKLELTEANFPELQRIVMVRSAEIIRVEHLTKSRAHLKAEDEIAKNWVAGNVSGMELSRWLARMRNGKRVYKRKGVSVSENGHRRDVAEPTKEVQTVTVSVPLQDTDTFNQSLTGRDKVFDPTLASLIEKCRRIGPGEVWSFAVESEDEARTLAGYMSRVAKVLNWRKGGHRHTYLYQIFPDKLKIKRMI